MRLHLARLQKVRKELHLSCTGPRVTTWLKMFCTLKAADSDLHRAIGSFPNGWNTQHDIAKVRVLTRCLRMCLLCDLRDREEKSKGPKGKAQKSEIKL